MESRRHEDITTDANNLDNPGSGLYCFIGASRRAERDRRERRNGFLRLDQQEIEFTRVVDRLRETASGRKDATVTIVAEAEAPFRDVVRLVDAARSVGVNRVGILRSTATSAAPRVLVPQGGVVLVVDRNRVLRLNGKGSKLNRVRPELERIFKGRADRTVFVQAYSALSFDAVAIVIDAAKEAGAGPIGLFSAAD